MIFVAIISSVAWVLWALASAIDVETDKLLGKRLKDAAGVSIMPAIPLFPVAAVVMAWVIDVFSPGNGTRLMLGFHLVLIVVFGAGTVLGNRRLRAAQDKSGPPPQ
jgi:hypothetical protein